MFNLGMGEITVILVLLLLFVGPSKLPELASGLGKLIRQVRKATSDVKNEIVLDDSFRKPFEELRDAVTLSPDELKRRDQIKESLAAVRKQAEELARAATTMDMDDGSATPPPETARRRPTARRPPARRSPARPRAPSPGRPFRLPLTQRHRHPRRRWRRFRRSPRPSARSRARRRRPRCRPAGWAAASA